MRSYKKASPFVTAYVPDVVGQILYASLANENRVSVNVADAFLSAIPSVLCL